MIEFNCSICQHDPSLPETLGCEKSTQDAVWADEEDTYYNCPLKWISESITSWYSEYNYIKEFGSSLPYSECSNCWLECWDCYRSELNNFEKMKMKPKKDGLSVLRDSFQKRNE